LTPVKVLMGKAPPPPATVEVSHGSTLAQLRFSLPYVRQLLARHGPENESD
jgi:hypothetical protein